MITRLILLIIYRAFKKFGTLITWYEGIINFLKLNMIQV